MCGRYSLFAPAETVEERLGATFEYAFEPRYNAAPGQSLPVVTNDEPETIRRMEWGLVPSWADDRSDFGLINARAETLTEKPSFAEAYERRRCLVPADGFYEWTDVDGGRVPYRVTLDDESVFAMAGVRERWEPSTRQADLGEFAGVNADETDVVETFAVVTTEPNDVVGELHHRMAVVLDPDDARTWLNGDDDARRDLLAPYDGEMRAYRVPDRVGDPANDDPGVVAPAGD